MFASLILDGSPSCPYPFGTPSWRVASCPFGVCALAHNETDPCGEVFPPPPGVAWPRPTHTLVITETGARYTFREHGERVYVTVRGSSSGAQLDNHVLTALPTIVAGVRMWLIDEYGLVLRSSRVTGWERWDLMTGYTSTSEDDADVRGWP